MFFLDAGRWNTGRDCSSSSMYCISMYHHHYLSRLGTLLHIDAGSVALGRTTNEPSHVTHLPAAWALFREDQVTATPTSIVLLTAFVFSCYLLLRSIFSSSFRQCPYKRIFFLCIYLHHHAYYSQILGAISATLCSETEAREAPLSHQQLTLIQFASYVYHTHASLFHQHLTLIRIASYYSQHNTVR